METHRRCFPAQPALSALQRFSRRKCAFLLCDLTATVDLLPHGALFSQQLLDLTHRWWTEREDRDIDINGVHPSQPHSTLTSSCIPDPAPFQLPDHRQPALSLTDFITAIAASQRSIAAFSLDGPRSYHGRNRILESVNCELGTFTLLFDDSATSTALSASLLVYWQAMFCALPVSSSGTAHSVWNPGRVASGAPHGSSLARFGSVSSKPESMWDKSCVGSVRFFLHVSPHTSHDFVSDSPFSVRVKSGASFVHFSPQLGSVCWRDPS